MVSLARPRLVRPHERMVRFTEIGLRTEDPEPIRDVSVDLTARPLPRSDIAHDALASTIGSD